MISFTVPPGCLRQGPECPAPTWIVVRTLPQSMGADHSSSLAWVRTRNLSINSAALCRLSYERLGGAPRSYDAPVTGGLGFRLRARPTAIPCPLHPQAPGGVSLSALRDHRPDALSGLLSGARREVHALRSESRNELRVNRDSRGRSRSSGAPRSRSCGSRARRRGRSGGSRLGTPRRSSLHGSRGATPPTPSPSRGPGGGRAGGPRGCLCGGRRRGGLLELVARVGGEPGFGPRDILGGVRQEQPRGVALGVLALAEGAEDHAVGDSRLDLGDEGRREDESRLPDASVVEPDDLRGDGVRLTVLGRYGRLQLGGEEEEQGTLALGPDDLVVGVGNCGLVELDM